MCGVPYHAVEGYLARLLRKGYRIAICDQMEDPKLTKKIVRREVTRVLPPEQRSTRRWARTKQLSRGLLRIAEQDSSSDWRVALLDVSTGEFRTAEFHGRNGTAQAAEAILHCRRKRGAVGRERRDPGAAGAHCRLGRASRIGCGRATLLCRWSSAS